MAPPPQNNGDAEFIAKKWVWVPDEVEGYVGGWVTKELEGDGRTVTVAESGQVVTLPLSELSDMNPPRFDKASDIADLTYLNEASVVHNLRQRYAAGLIYTYSSIFLVAVNPYRSLPIYSQSTIDQYRNRRKEENAPHIFAIAERAWVNMREGRESQSVLITGESGAGKTENTKKVIQYLAAIATETNTTSSSVPGSSSSSSPVAATAPPFLQRSTSTRSVLRSGSNRNLAEGGPSGRGMLERQILEANPILEAFGNAQTMRNNNSSRFGKFVRIFFSPSGAIAGANINWYLLEKSRVAFRSSGERSFHVFYMLLAACQAKGEGGRRLREDLLLDGSAADYEYLNKSAQVIEGVNDLEEWKLLTDALDVVGFSKDREQLDLFRIVAAILHLGNIEISGDRSNQAQIRTPSQVEKACHLLGIPPAEFTKAVLRPKVMAGRETVVQARTKQQAVDEIASLAKTVYAKTFGAIVEMVNRALDRPKETGTFIGVLDIAGFEIFEINSFEQLCINYTNEKLQQFFNHHMFVLEQQEYAREEIEWDYVDFGHDLQSTIELIEGSSAAPIGILSCLDEECIMPQASDTTFLSKLTHIWTPSTDPRAPSADGCSKFGTLRFTPGFTVQHYAGKVEYRTDGWLDKNKDPLNSNITSVLAASTNKFVASLFAEFSEEATSQSAYGRRVKTGAFRTGSQRHQEELTKLMLQLDSTNPHFVRCIVPNRFKQPGRIDVPLVLDQLRCNGVLEGIRIARRGYPNRLPFSEFRQRYEILTPNAFGRGYVDGRVACQAMIDALQLDKEVVKLGTTKVFFKVGVLADLQERLDAHLFDLVSRFQAAARRFTARRQLLKILNRDAAVRTIQRNARIYNDLREWPWWQLFTTVQPLLAATRNDLELQRKNAELLFAKERAERDEKEKASLENLRLQLESDKKDIEADLEAERAIRLNEAEVHGRTVVQCQSEIQDLKADMDVIADQLERAMEAKAAAEARSLQLRNEFDELAGAVEELEEDTKVLREREGVLLGDVKSRTEGSQRLEVERDQLKSSVAELKRKVQASEEDLVKAKARVGALEKELVERKESDSQKRTLESTKITALEQEASLVKDRLAELMRSVSESETRLQKKDIDISRLHSDLSSSSSERKALEQANAQLDVKLQSHVRDLGLQKDIASRETQARTNLEKEIDDLRTTMGSQEMKRSEAEKSKEQEIGSLRTAVGRLESELAQASRQASAATEKITLELEGARREHGSLARTHQELVDKSSSLEKKVVALEDHLAKVEEGRRAAEEELQSVRSRLIDADAALTETRKAKETLDRQLAKSQKKNNDYEDAIIAIEREKGSWAAQMSELQRRLEAENKQRLKLEDDQLKRNSELTSLQDRLGRTERELLKVGTDFDAIDAEVRLLRSRENKTIVEHVHVLEAAKRLTDRQLAEAKLELQSLTVYVKSLEKTKARDAEDLSRQGERERAAARNQESVIKAAEERARLKLLKELQSSNENMATGISSQARSLLNHSNNSNSNNLPFTNGHHSSSNQNQNQSSDKAQVELAEARRQISDFNFERKKLQTEAAQLKTKLEEQQRSSVKTRQPLSPTASSSDTVLQLQQTVQTLKSKYNDCFSKFEAAEAARLQAEELVLSREQELRDLRDEDNARQARLEEELEEQHSKILSDRGFDFDMKKERYHGALALATSENAAHIKKISDLRNDNRNLKADKEALQFKLDDEIFAGSSWKKEKDRFEMGLVDLREGKQAAEVSLEQARAEAVKHMSQLRDLRSEIDERDAAVRVAGEKAALAVEKQRMAEAAMVESQTESTKLRDEIAVVERRNAQIEKQLRDANIRVIDYETTTPRTPTSTAPRDLPSLNPNTTPSRNRSSFLFNTPGNASSPGGAGSSFGTPRGSEVGSVRRGAGSGFGTPEARLVDYERRYEGMRRSKEDGDKKLEELREFITTQQRTENDLNIAKRKAEREATDQKALCLGKEREIEQLKEQLYRSESRFFQTTSSDSRTRS